MNSPMIYEFRQPKGINPNKRYPALFIMHGMGSNEQDLLSLVDGLEEQFFIFSIRGHLHQRPGFVYFTIQGFGKPHRVSFREAVDKITGFIDYTYEKYPLDPEQIYLLGFSQGAILGITLALTLGNRIKGIAALSGYIPALVKEEYELKPVEGMSVFISHGEMDPILPFEWGESSAEYFQGLGADVAFYRYKQGHTVSLENYNDLTSWLTQNINTKGDA